MRSCEFHTNTDVSLRHARSHTHTLGKSLGKKIQSVKCRRGAPTETGIGNHAHFGTLITKDHDRGMVVGETTFGKGLVQTVEPLSENTGLALTIARYYTPSGRLIQRDYKSMSLYAYHYERKIPERPTEVRLTDSGRQVTGGGGIVPDIAVHEPQLNRFQLTLLRADVFYPFENSVGGFTRHYLGTRPETTRDFEADDAVMTDLRKFLAGRNVRYSESELAENLAWVKRKIKQEVFIPIFGQQEGFKVQLNADPQLIAAVDAIPQARALYASARKILAEREGIPTYRP
jgi:carboxyl-terminal processing protease